MLLQLPPFGTLAAAVLQPEHARGWAANANAIARHACNQIQPQTHNQPQFTAATILLP